MKYSIVFCYIVLSIILVSNSFGHKNDFPVLKGPYLGQKPPGMTPEIFAPGIVSTEDQKEFSCTFSSDGKEFYFNRNMQIMVSKWLKTGWSKPEPVTFTEGYPSHEPHITADNKRLFFGSMRPRPGFPDEENPYGIWMAERTEEGWNKPRYVGYGMYVTTTSDGEIYLEDIREAANLEFCIVRTKLLNGHFEEFIRQKGGMDRPAPDRLPGGHPCISLDGSFIIFDSSEIETRMTANLFICLHEDLDTWSEAIRFDDSINKPKEATLCPYLSPDGKYFFFTRMVEKTGDIYWVDAKIIDQFKPKIDQVK